MGKGSKFIPSSTFSRKMVPVIERLPGQSSNSATAAGARGKKKTGARLWMRFDREGISEIFECDKGTISRRMAIPARDLRILGPVFSHSSNILARERAMVVNLEFIKAIVTAEEVWLLDPLSQEVLPFVDQLRQLIPPKTDANPPLIGAHGRISSSSPKPRHQTADTIDSLQSELPFEFQVLEMALEVVCTHLDSNVADLEREAYPLLDKLARNVNTKSLERVRSLKGILTRLLAQVQKVRDELEHLLDDTEYMSCLYLTRKYVQNQQLELSVLTNRSNTTNSLTISCHLHHTGLNNWNNGGTIATIHYDDENVEDLEMLLEAYFMQLDGTRNKIISVREYIDDTEDCVNIQLDSQRNELIQLQLIMVIASFGVAFDTLIVSIFGMNIPCTLYSIDGIFWPIVFGSAAFCFLIFLVILGYGRWKRLIGV